MTWMVVRGSRWCTPGELVYLRTPKLQPCPSGDADAGLTAWRALVIGVLTGFNGPIPTVALMARQVRLQGLTVGSRKQQIEMIRALAANDMKPVIDKT